MSRLNASRTAEQGERFTSLRDAIVNADHSQIDNYIDANVTDMASAKAFLKKLTKVVVAIARQTD